LLDAVTIRQNKGRIAGLKVAIVGDVLHSRVARSNAHLLSKLAAHVVLAGPRTLLPLGLEKQIAPSEGSVTFADSIEEAITDADVVMMLRIQLERQAGGFFPSLREYSIHYGLNRRRLQLAKPDAIVLHPGPINRGVEIDSDVADGPFSLIMDQVSNGVAVRMAVLYLLAGGD
jgi:aspartate carbamoyltransferase catalytic subunit